MGSIHTHPDGPPGPSDVDLEIATRLRPHEYRAVCRPPGDLFLGHFAQAALAQNGRRLVRWHAQIKQLDAECLYELIQGTGDVSAQ